MKKSYLILLLLSNYFLTAQTNAGTWNFDTSSTNPTTGSGTLTLVGGTGSIIYSNNSGGKSLGFADFPNVNVGSGTAGIQFAFSTVGYSGISVTFDASGHNQSSKWQQYQYTINGTNWIVLGNNNGGLTAGFLTTILNFPVTCDNNANFAFRVVSMFDPNIVGTTPANTEYQQITGGGYNGSNGKWYFDNVGIRYNTLSTNSFNAIYGLNMYPNPSNGNTLYFTTAVNAELDIQVYDMLGKQVINSKVLNNALNISSLNQGIYIVKITEEGKTATRKLVVR